jgi:hypothetical protein
VFMKKIMMIHSVTMLLLLAGMFGLSMAAMELSKETKVGAAGSLVTRSGDAVLVGSSEMQVVSGPDGSQQLRPRTSSDGRRLDESESALVTVSVPDAVVLDLGVEGEDGDRRLAQEHRYYELTYHKMKTLLKKMPSRDAKFTPYLGEANAAGNAMIEAGEIVGEFVGGGSLQDLRDGWDTPTPSLKMRLQSRTLGVTVRVEVACERGTRAPCEVDLIGNTKGFDLGSFLVGASLDSNDDVLCLKLDDSAACQATEYKKRVDFQMLTKYVAVESNTWQLDGDGYVSGAADEIKIVRHLVDGKSKPIGGELVVGAGDELLIYSRFGLADVSAKLDGAKSLA